MLQNIQSFKHILHNTKYLVKDHDYYFFNIFIIYFLQIISAGFYAVFGFDYAANETKSAKASVY